MKAKSRLARIASLTLLVATLTINTASRAGAAVNTSSSTAAQDASTVPATEIEFGAIKLGRGQRALIIVVCAADESGGDQRPVNVEFMFHDWDGNVLDSVTKTILPGHASEFEMRAGIRIPGNPSELQPCIKVLVDPSDPIAKRVTATLQISDENGKVQSITCRKAGEKPLE